MSVCEASLGSGEGAGRFCPTCLFWLPLRQSLALPLMEGTCWLWSLFQCLGLLTLGWKAPGSGVLGQGGHSPCSSGGQGRTDSPQYNDSYQFKRVSGGGIRELWGEASEDIKSKEAVFLTISLLKPPRLFLPHLYHMYLF